MKKLDMAYTAGIIDGEGCISIRREWDKRYHGCYKYSLIVQVASTDEWLCQWLHFSWGGSIAFVVRDNPKWKPHWVWQIASKQALLFLESVSPYMHIKKPQAELAITYQRKQKQGGKPNRELSISKEADYIRLKYMKHQTQRLSINPTSAKTVLTRHRHE